MSKSYRAMGALTVALLSIGLVFGIYTVRHPRSRSQGGKLIGASEALPIAPEFSLTDLNGQPLKLSSFHGKVILIDYWATWCAPCKIEIPRLIVLQNKYKAQGLQVIGLSMDDGPGPVRIFARELGINYPIALGNVKVAEAYGGVLGLPIAFLIDRQGRISRKLVGDAEMQSIESDVQKLLRQP